jgi:hypothetical protein
MTKPNDPVIGQFHGLTKREYFAAMAMQGFLAHGYGCSINAVLAADALIKELNKTANDQGN